MPSDRCATPPPSSDRRVTPPPSDFGELDSRVGEGGGGRDGCGGRARGSVVSRLMGVVAPGVELGLVHIRCFCLWKGTNLIDRI
jgi:hypothetical protein